MENATSENRGAPSGAVSRPTKPVFPTKVVLASPDTPFRKKAGIK
jgi:hypothetical protein